jgi:hypothetical protein
MKWLLWPWRQYQRWMIQRELHIANDANPLFWGRLIWEAVKTAALPIILTIVLFFFGFTFRDFHYVAGIAGDLIAFIALWFGLRRSRDTAVIDAIATVCRRLPHAHYANGYQHVGEMIPNFRHQLRFYNLAIIVVNVALFLVGVALSFLG